MLRGGGSCSCAGGMLLGRAWKKGFRRRVSVLARCVVYKHNLSAAALNVDEVIVCADSLAIT